MQLIVKKGISIFVLLVVILLLLSALGVAALRTLAPMGGKYTDNIQHAVSELIGRPVKIGHLEFTVSGVTPTARLKDLVIYDQAGSQPEMSFNEMDITLDMLSSAVKLDWIPSKVILRGSRILVDRTIDGRFLVSGFEFSGSSSDQPQSLDILNDVTFQVQDLEVYWNDEPLGLSYELYTDVMDVYISQDALALNGSVTLPDGIDSDVELAIDIKGPLQEYRKWQGNFSASTTELKLAGLPLELLAESPMRLNEGDARFVVWGTWQGDDTLKAEADVAFSNINMDTDKSSSLNNELLIDKLQTKLDINIDKGQWLINSDSLNLTTNGQVWPESGYSVNFKLEDKVLQGLSANVDFLDVSSATTLLASLRPNSPQWKEYLTTHQPQGNVHNLSLSYSGVADEKIQDFHATGEFSAIHWQQGNKIPGIGELSGNFTLGADSGDAYITSQQFTFSSETLFTDPILLDDLNASLNWQKTEQGTELKITDLNAVNTDISVAGAGGLTFIANSPPVIDLQLTSPGTELERVYKYLPLTLKPKVREWIKRGIIGGRGDDVNFSINGPLSKQAFRDRQLKLDGTVQASGVTVHYLNDYPDITDVSGAVRFLDYGLKADLSAGKVHGSNITSGWVGIENYFQAVVELDTKSSGTAVGGIEYLENSKLGAKILPFLDSVETNGNVDLRLQIEVPLGKMKSQRQRVIKGTIGLKDNLLALPANDIEFLNTVGQLEFNGANFSAKDIRSKFRGKPVSGSVVTKSDREIHISVSGRMAVAELLPDNELLPAITSGDSLWNGTVVLPSRTDAANGVKQKLVLSSQLMGTELDLPDPVGKQSDQTRRVVIETALNGDSRIANVTYGDDLNAALELRDNGYNFKIPRIAVVCGKDQPRLPAQGYILTGACGELDLQSWIASVRDLSGTKMAGNQSRISVNTELEMLAFAGQSFRNVSLQMASNDPYWDVDIASETLAGSMRIPTDLGETNRIVADLQRLHLTTSEEEGGSGVSPKSIPGLDVRVQEFVYNEKNLGSVNIDSSREPVGMRIDQLELTRDNITANISGNWNELGQNSSVSQLEMQVEGKNFGALLSDLGVSKNMRNAEGTLDADVSWQGAPYKIDFETLSGVLNTTLREGSLTDVEPGLARVFGLINFDSLPKRIGLQFSDVAGKGLFFEKLAGRVAVEKGVATLDKITIESDSANMDLIGSSDMVAKTYDLDLSVIPNVTSTVPLATTLIAGPQTGALVYLLDKVTQGAGVDFNQSIAQSYTIDGSWEKPDITHIQNQQIDDEEDNLFEGD